MNVIVNQEDLNLSVSEDSVIQLAREVVSFEKKSYDEVAIHFVDVERISTLHDQFFGDPSPTDCISFPLAETGDKSPYKMLGDVFVSAQAARDFIKESEGEFFEELSLYIVHGILHLMGYDDIEDADRKLMRQAEKRHLTHLKELGLLIHG